MFAVYAAAPNADAPLDSLTVGERPEPEAPEGWVAVTVTAASLQNRGGGWICDTCGAAPQMQG